MGSYSRCEDTQLYNIADTHNTQHGRRRYVVNMCVKINKIINNTMHKQVTATNAKWAGITRHSKHTMSVLYTTLA